METGSGGEGVSSCCSAIEELDVDLYNAVWVCEELDEELDWLLYRGILEVFIAGLASVSEAFSGG